MKKILMILLIISCFILIIFVSMNTFSQQQKVRPHSQYEYEKEIYYRIGCYLCVNYETKKYRYIKFKGNDTHNLRKKAETRFNCKVIDVWSKCPIQNR